jgi:LCP family protein required for cell wall assembly
LRNTLIVIGSIIGVLVIGGGVAYAMAQHWFNQVEKDSIVADPNLKRPAATVVEDGEKAPINILLLGSDSRATTTSTTGFRSDTIMVAQVSPSRDQVTMMSIMRDNWVPIEGHGEAKINAAFSYGGIPLAVNTVENFIGARIDHVMIVDFESFQGLTDAVGGVTVYNTVAFNQTATGQFFPEGEVFISSGTEALDFVRERYAFDDGDYQRVRNQQAFMKGLVQGILSRDTLTSPKKILDTANALQPYLVVDEGFSLNRAVELGTELGSLRGDGITFFTSPTLGIGRSDDGQSIVLVNWDEMASVQAAFQNGTLHEYAAGVAPGSEAPQ